MGCNSTMNRTNTTQYLNFYLPPPDEATLSFSSDSTTVSITIPWGSRWRMPLHWHADDALDCLSVRCLSGHLRVFRANKYASGDFLKRSRSSAVTFEPGKSVAWCSAKTQRDLRTCTEDWAVEFVVADHALYRNVRFSSLQNCKEFTSQRPTDLQRRVGTKHLSQSLEHTLLAEALVQSSTLPS